MKHPIDKLDFGLMGIATYRGCILAKNKNGYSMWGKIYKSAKEIDEAIDNAGQSISNSISIKNENGNFTAINEDGI